MCGVGVGFGGCVGVMSVVLSCVVFVMRVCLVFGCWCVVPGLLGCFCVLRLVLGCGCWLLVVDFVFRLFLCFCVWVCDWCV